MKRRHAIIAIVLAGAILVPATAVLAGGFGPGGHRGAMGLGMGPEGGHVGEMLMRLADRLELTDEQRTQIRTILQDEEPAVRDLYRQMAESRRTFQESQTPGTFDEAAVRANAQARAALMVEAEVAQARVRAHVLAVLTPEQLTKLNELRSDFKAQREGRNRR